MRYLGIDLGTSFVKGAVLDLDELALEHIERQPSPEALRGSDPAFREFAPDAVVTAAREVLERLHRHAPDAAGVLVCSQLHGLVLTREDGRAQSPLIGWQDQRALRPFPGGPGSYFDALQARLTTEERRQLGNEARPGVPVCFLFWLEENGTLPRAGCRAQTLPGFVVARLCGGEPGAEATQAFGSGAFNLETSDWHQGVLAKLGLERVRWPAIVAQGSVVGEWRAGNRTLPVFTPVGDCQCSQVGALIEEGELSINISTGSAVVQLSPQLVFGDYQTRPFFDGQYLRTVTHIPAGRALNALIGLLSELAAAQGVELADPWDYILAEAGRLESTDLRLDPAFYFSAMGERGAILNAHEGNLTVGHLFRAAFEGMAGNYCRCAARLSPERCWSRAVFSGGIALKVELLRHLICGRLALASRLAPSAEDTLLGLLVLALAFGGRAASVAEAASVVRKRYETAS